MALETKPVAKVKVGMWINRIKLRRALFIVSLFYAVILLALAYIDFLNGRNTIAMFEVIFAMPLLMILYSRHKFNKIKDEIE